MPALVACPPPPPRLHPAPSSSSLYHTMDHDDLLSETLHDAPTPDPNNHDFTDDLEDIVSMSVAQQLHSRRSHQTLQTYLPSSPPLAPPSLPTSPHSAPRFSPSPSPSLSASSDLDAIGTRASALNRSHSTGPASRGKRRPSAIPRPGTGGKSADAGRRKGSLPGAESDSGAEADPAASASAGWETLQVAPSLTASAAPAKRKAVSPARPNGAATPARTPSTPMGRSKTVDFPQSGSTASVASSGGATRPRHATPSASKPSPSSASTSSTPRKRAQTQASQPTTNGASPSRGPPGAPTSASTTRRPSAARTQTSTSTAPSRPAGSSSTGTGGPKPRRKSLSTAQELAALRERAGVAAVPSSSTDPLLNSSSAYAGGAMPDWAEPAPLVYRTSKGDLAFASAAVSSLSGPNGGAEGPAVDWRKLRPEDYVVPAVARRLERERLAALQREGGGDALVTEWGPDGTPRSAVSWKSRERGSVGGTGEGQGEGEGLAPDGREEGEGAAAERLQHDAGRQHVEQPYVPPPRKGSLAPPSDGPLHQPNEHSSPAAPPANPDRPHRQVISLDSPDGEPKPFDAAAGRGEKALHGAQDSARPATAADDDAAAGKAGCCRCVVS
ncbi:hypothetical protein JCM10207_000054 [Rhodosporidiobolus poonsookiae]